jgi:hypothetical protein
MKNLIVGGLAAAVLVSFSACKTVVETPRVHSTTTTTDEQTVHPLNATTTETQSIHSNQ